ncbi:filamentous hemagglutinin family outer membrane protein [Brenneria sp. EniD312]|uniref:VENN motif pre-toxin domain-containing protein n=1 Tax=Brenneria TaxID=71655 RepID=UPI00022F793D|nr:MULTISPECIES: VENN motif pre-toxin domain-containing protein [Brenneria]EHD21342.1 filamentous hemagglutinin family outer membrane protein [Brenneria sp. EniD312]
MTIDAYKTYKKSEAVAQARTRLTQEGVSADEIEARIQSSEEVQAVEREYGAGSEYWTAGTALTAGLGGNATGVVTGAAAPYLAGLVKEVSQDNESARIALHTVLGAFLAQAQGGSAAGGAVGGLVSSAGAQALTALLYPGVKGEELTGEQKELIANLITLAGAGAGGLVGGNLTGAGSGANTAKNEVENNYFNLGKGLQDYSQSVMSLYTNTNLTDEDGNVLNPITEEERQYAMHKLLTGTIPEGQDISQTIVDGYTNGVLIAGAWYLGPAASIGKVAVGSALGGGANAAYQWYDQSQSGNESKTYDYWSTTAALVTGGLAPGRNIWQNVGIAAGGAVFTDGPNVGAVGGAATGALFGAKFGQYAPDIINSIIGKDLPGFVYDVGGAFVSETVNDVSKDALKIKESKK